MFGYNGKILRINLSTQNIIKEKLSEDVIKKYIGGQGIGAKYLYEEVPHGVNPLDDENKIILAVGPFEGTNIPGSARTCIVSKSPLTGYLGDTDVGGFLGRKLKLAGYDCIIIEGKAKIPVFINIKKDEVKVENGFNIWGKSVLEAHEYLKKRNKDGSTLVIGEAGENLVRYSCISSDLRYFAGRSGIGAVMGSKNLKGIVVSGDKNIKVKNPEKLKELRNEFNQDLINDKSCATLTRFGTWNGTAGVNQNGVMPTKNFQKTTFDLTDNIDGPSMEEKLQVGQKTCFACPIACRNVVTLQKGDEASPYGGPQYEAVAALGSLLLNGDPFAIARLNRLCNHLGLDVISTGVSVAFLLECLDKNILSFDDVGFEINWGEEDKIARLIKLIAKRKGIGDIMAEGVKKASKEIGGSEFAIHVKGLEVAMHDPRGKKGQGLSYATSHKGADHMESMHDEAFQNENALPELGFEEPLDRKDISGKAQLVKLLQDYWGTMADCLVTCKFFMIPPRPFTPERVIKSVNYITGWDYTLEEFTKTGERIFNLCRLYNLREGMDPEKEDKLPARFSKILDEGGSKGENISEEEFRNELEEYYNIRGWENGVPSKEKIEELDLEFAL